MPNYYLCEKRDVNKLLERAEKEKIKILNDLKMFVITHEPISIEVKAVKHVTGFAIHGDLLYGSKVLRSYECIDLLFLDLNELMLKLLIEERQKQLNRKECAK